MLIIIPIIPVMIKNNDTNLLILKLVSCPSLLTKVTVSPDLIFPLLILPIPSLPI